MPLCIGGVADGEWVKDEGEFRSIARSRMFGYAEPPRELDKKLYDSMSGRLSPTDTCHIDVTSYERIRFEFNTRKRGTVQWVVYVDRDAIKDDVDVLDRLFGNYRPIKGRPVEK